MIKAAAKKIPHSYGSHMHHRYRKGKEFLPFAGECGLFGRRCGAERVDINFGGLVTHVRIEIRTKLSGHALNQR